MNEIVLYGRENILVDFMGDWGYDSVSGESFSKAGKIRGESERIYGEGGK